MSSASAGLIAIVDGTGTAAAGTDFAAGSGGALRRGACATRGAQLQIPLIATIAAKLTNRAVIRAVVRTREGYSISMSASTLELGAHYKLHNSGCIKTVFAQPAVCFVWMVIADRLADRQNDPPGKSHIRIRVLKNCTSACSKSLRRKARGKASMKAFLFILCHGVAFNSIPTI
jgi:hypothetical protein